MSDRREHDRIVAEIARPQPGSDPFAAAVRATRMPMLITDPNRADNPILFVNDAFLKLTGYTRPEILGRNCRFLQGPETDQADVARIRDAVERRMPIELELLNHRKDGSVFWNRLLISPVFDGDGALTYFFASQFDVTLERDRLVRLQRDRDALETEAQRRAEELTRSEARLRFMLQAGGFGTWSLDPAESRFVASEVCRQTFARPPSEPFSYEDLLAAVFPPDRERLRAAMQGSLAGRSDLDIEIRIVAGEGEVRWVHLRGQTFHRADGSPLSMQGVSLDITERKRSEEHRGLLASELTHRVKNSMATMQSIAHQTLRNARTLEEARTTLDARLHSLSAAHDVLTRESWEGATLSEIVQEALRPFRSARGHRFKVGGPEVRLTPRIALAFVMALHELATNAVKYGALSVDEGRVILNWEVLDGPEAGRLWLRWEEIGGPPVSPPERKGFGSRMIERALAGEINGAAEIEYRPRGIVVTVEAPLPDPQG